MNRERYLMKTFPDKEGLTYIQSMDKSMRKEKEKWQDGKTGKAKVKI